MQATKINIIVNNKKIIYNSSGSIAGAIDQGFYIAEFNANQQPGWYSLYESDKNFSKKGLLKLANIVISIGNDGRVYILA